MDELKKQAEKLNAIMDKIGVLTSEEWAQLAMLCVDQAGMPIKVQSEIAMKLVIALSKRV